MPCNPICNNFQCPQAPYYRRLQHLCTCMPWSSAMSIMLYPQVWSIKLITRQGSYNFTAVKMLHMCHFVCYPSMSISTINRDIELTRNQDHNWSLFKPSCGTWLWTPPHWSVRRHPWEKFTDVSIFQAKYTRRSKYTCQDFPRVSPS